MTRKTIILAKCHETGRTRYVIGGGRALTDDIADAALYNAPSNALPIVERMLRQNFERTMACELLLGEVELTVVSETEIPRKPQRRGWVIRREDGQYYNGPRTRDPSSYHEARYKYVMNVDAATVFPCLPVAEQRAAAIAAILKSAGSRGGAPSFAAATSDFQPTLEEV